MKNSRAHVANVSLHFDFGNCASLRWWRRRNSETFSLEGKEFTECLTSECENAGVRYRRNDRIVVRNSVSGTFACNHIAVLVI